MPRPTVAQLAYGSATVILSTLAMLLLSQTSSGPGIGVIAISAVILGLFVAMSVPTRKAGAQPQSEPAADGPVTARRIPSPARGTAAESVREREPAGP
ncbi:hypothetical protein [Streptomyces longispororuber]|uniref:hypothetical protein n=1 Tax=Streptomyces longispororuber TaxID=68230 RepID=UPI0021097639|nr:hypothetical protein [Streptomyces longispororuber]MCQ4209481.1 hypothetical protein [Streptomyces longispororuber]